MFSTPLAEEIVRSVVLPVELDGALEQLASRQNISVNELLVEQVKSLVKQPPRNTSNKAGRRKVRD